MTTIGRKSRRCPWTTACLWSQAFLLKEEYQKIMDPRRKLLYRSLTQLPERDRMLLYRKYLLGQSYHQIAGELCMNESTLASALQRAKKKLRRQIERLEDAI